MKQENVLSMMAGVVLGVCAMLLFFRNNSQPSTNQPDSVQTQTTGEKPIPSTSTEETKPLPESTIYDPVRELQAARSRQLAERERRERLLELYPDDYFDPMRYHQSGDAEYRDKVQKHFHIASWAYSERKDDPALREVMLLLLENGYGIEDYSSVIRVLSFHKAEVEALRESYESLGFYTALEIEEMLEASGAYRRQAERWEGAKRSLARQGITDANLVEALWTVDIGLIREGDGAIGEGKVETVRGDYLLTEEDWLEAEFAAAQARYSGPARGTMAERVVAWRERMRIEAAQRRRKRIAEEPQSMQETQSESFPIIP